MNWRALWVSIGLALVWTGVALYVVRPADSSPANLRTFVIEMGPDTYRVQADRANVEGFCTVFTRNGMRIAAVCGQHTWSEAVEVQ